MLEARLAFNHRVNELDEYFSLLGDLIENESKVLKPDGSNTKISSKLSATLKSSAQLLLYNLIESTLYNCLQDIHDTINREKLKYHELTESLKKIWLEFRIGNKTNNIPNLSKEVINHILSNRDIEIELDEYLSIKNLFSGNLDARKIRDVTEKYGLILSQQTHGKKLLIIKRNRNSLAHGKISFSHCSKDLVMSDLNKIKDDVINFLSILIGTTEDYIANKRYLINHTSEKG